MADKIVVIGSANTDLVIHSKKMPLLGETLVGSNFQINAGGKGLNQAIAVSRLGGDVSFVCAVGTDSNGDVLIRELRENGVTFKGIRTENISTGVAMITVVEGNNFIIINPGANDSLTPEVVESFTDVISESEFCIMQLEIPLDTIAKVCEIAKANGTKIVLNPAPYKEIPKEIMESVDFLIPNEYEAEGITGIYPGDEDSCKKAITKLREMGVRCAIITLGDRGCVYSRDDEAVFCPAEKAVAVDTTSAGDCFVGAVVTKLTQGETLECAISFATKASAITVSREGASKSIPRADEII